MTYLANPCVLADSMDPAVDLGSTNCHYYSLLAGTFHEVNYQCYVIWETVVVDAAEDGPSHCLWGRCLQKVLVDQALNGTVADVEYDASLVALNADVAN